MTHRSPEPESPATPCLKCEHKRQLRREKPLLFIFKVVGLLASEWNIPLFDFVGQMAALKDHFWCDTCVTLVPPKQEISVVLRESLRYLGWEHIGVFGVFSAGSSCEEVDEMWRAVEDGLQFHFNNTASMRHNGSSSERLQDGLRSMSSVARGKYARVSSPFLLFGDVMFTNSYEPDFILIFL